MQRSMKLGHCICDPRKPCPCDVLVQKDVCLCAGERLEVPAGPARLTQMVQNPGCASKIDLTALKSVLAGLPSSDDPRVSIGVAAGDDAGVFRVDAHTTLVQTVDVFTPCVDDPYTFGQIAAANSLSDIYAMGGTPLTALSIIGFPIRSVPDSVMREILRGGIDKMLEAGVAVIGGHSINDAEVKAGFAVTGVVDPDRILANSGVRPGDALVLTKPLGAGILNFAAQIGRVFAEGLTAAARSMACLNRTAAQLMARAGAHACTDVTGFGLLGHLSQMAAASRVDVDLFWDDLPLFPDVLECLAAGLIPGAVERNREAVEGCVQLGEGVEQAMLDLCLDAQTSGGLLVALPEEAAQRYAVLLRTSGVTDAAVIGRAAAAGSGRITLRTRGTRPIPAAPPLPTAARATPARQAQPEPDAEGVRSAPTEKSCCTATKDQPSCAEPPAAGRNAGQTTTSTDGIGDSFAAFLRQANSPGALDAYTKEALALALSIHARCGPCTEAHIKKARKMGFSTAEIDEAAWLAIAFGGSPVMMFYDQYKGR
jgi:selenide,water dikinase